MYKHMKYYACIALCYFWLYFSHIYGIVYEIDVVDGCILTHVYIFPHSKRVVWPICAMWQLYLFSDHHLCTPSLVTWLMSEVSCSIYLDLNPPCMNVKYYEYICADTVCGCCGLYMQCDNHLWLINSIIYGTYMCIKYFAYMTYMQILVSMFHAHIHMPIQHKVDIAVGCVFENMCINCRCILPYSIWEQCDVCNVTAIFIWFYKATRWSVVSDICDQYYRSIVGATEFIWGTYMYMSYIWLSNVWHICIVSLGYLIVAHI